MGGIDIEWYRKKYPEMIKICIFCLKEFVPKLEGRGRTTLTCSPECSKDYTKLSEGRKKESRKMAAQFASSRSRGGENHADDRDPVGNEIKKGE